MGSLQSEIQKTLQSWEPQRGLPAREPRTFTVNKQNEPIAKKIFDYVKINPSCTSKDIVRDMPFDLGRVSATLLGLYQRGKVGRKEYPNPDSDSIHSTIYCYWTEVNDYRDKGVSRKPKKSKKAKALSKAEVLIKELDEPVVERPRVEMPRMKQFAEPSVFDAEAFVANMNVHDAKKVYTLLRRIFG